MAKTTMQQWKAAAWTLTVLGIGLGILGFALGWYDQVAWLDEALHGLTTFAIALLIAAYAHASIFREAGDFYGGWKIIMPASTALAVGVLWELAEWLYDAYVRGNVMKDEHDTMIDLSVDAGAALLAGLVGLWAARRMRRYG